MRRTQAGNRRIARAIAAPLAVMATGIGVVAVHAPAASAGCWGTGGATTHILYVSGTERARETVQYASTCDNDNFYAGRIRDSVTDGSCAYARFYDAGVWSTQGVECTTGAWANYSFRDRNGDRNADIRVATDYAGVTTDIWGF